MISNLLQHRNKLFRVLLIQTFFIVTLSLCVEHLPKTWLILLKSLAEGVVPLLLEPGLILWHIRHLLSLKDQGTNIRQPINKVVQIGNFIGNGTHVWIQFLQLGLIDMQDFFHGQGNAVVVGEGTGGSGRSLLDQDDGVLLGHC